MKHNFNCICYIDFLLAISLKLTYYKGKNDKILDLNILSVIEKYNGEMLQCKNLSKKV